MKRKSVCVEDAGFPLQKTTHHRCKRVGCDVTTSWAFSNKTGLSQQWII